MTTATYQSLKTAKSGIGLRHPHMGAVLSQKPDVGFLEAHSENYFRIGGVPFDNLMRCRADYAISLHGVGLSLGSADGVKDAHLQKLKALVDLIDPVMVSEHISWSGHGPQAVPDLLPLPLTAEALDTTCRNITHVQDTLGRQIFVENPSCYISFPADDGMTEPDFITQIIERTGCKLLLDVNNVAVSAHNLGYDPLQYINALPCDIVGEMHLAGYQVNNVGGADVLIDAHNHPVYDGVWQLYDAALARFGNTPTLLEWDSDLPALGVLVAEAAKADARRNQMKQERHARAG
ncbi:MAG TPA: DUF692 domain-containing protein [Alphaproteobacteria bacterium]|nr:DUF692 domain-containing protein [Alphaproteobacteria bacterium]